MAREHREDHAQPVAVDAVRHPAGRHHVRRRDQRLDLDQQRARALHRAQNARAGHRLGVAQEAVGGIGHLVEPAGAHLEHADLVRGPEPVLERAQRAETALALALELQHAVDRVLEHARPGQRALLGDVADQDHRAAALAREALQRRRHLLHLADAAGRARQVGGPQGLDRVDHACLRALLLQRREHDLERGLGQHGHRQGVRAEALRAQLDLGRRLLAADVERAAAGAPGSAPAQRSSGCSCRCPESRRSAPPSRARGRRPAPGRARRCPCAAARARRPRPPPAPPACAAPRPWTASAPSARPCDQPAVRLRTDGLFHKGVPLTAAGAAAHPPQAGLTA